MKLGIVCVGGESPNEPVAGERVLNDLRTAVSRGDAFVVAADSGLDRAEYLELAVDLIVGDLDSVSAAALERATAAGMAIEQHPSDKASSDLELAIASALRQGVERLVILGESGGRLDHLLIGISVLCGAAQQVPVEAWLGSQHVVVVTDRWAEELRIGTTLTLLAWNGPAVVSVAGVRWPLDHDELVPASSLGLSNESTELEIEVVVHSGTVLLVIPQPKEKS